MKPKIAARLEQLNIQWTANEKGYTFFHRENVAAVSFQGGTPGSAGLMTDNGLSYLIWRNGEPVLAAHGGGEIAAKPEQVDAIERFSSDLKSALRIEE